MSHVGVSIYIVFQEPVLNGIEVLALLAVTEVLRWSLIIHICYSGTEGYCVANRISCFVDILFYRPIVL